MIIYGNIQNVYSEIILCASRVLSSSGTNLQQIFLEKKNTYDSMKHKQINTNYPNTFYNRLSGDEVSKVASELQRSVVHSSLTQW